MKSWAVVVAPSVWAAIRAQVLYIAAHSPANALAWEARLDTAIFGLTDGPTDAVDEDASARLGYPVRKLVFERTYLVFYRRDDPSSVVNVVGFRHGARLPQQGEP